ncbi:MAG: hypothetical protein COY80_05405 [Candidatus Pacebacteria bacterium CG_4_10_14_0_8_um_filter_42_14]|nr:MAG: hypothetical protein COY80_05405 [Candidatus Pacebacteria bacterium CG_4_10_14_0_8_um_filter_42_14]
MNKRSNFLLGIFFSIALPIFSLGTYILITKGSLRPKSFFTSCFEVIKNVQEHIHLHPQAMLGAFVITIFSISIILVMIRLIAFLISYQHLKALPNDAGKPLNIKLSKLLKKHNINDEIVTVTEGQKLTAYAFGLFKPKIVISKLLLQKSTNKQLEAIILHELFHIKQRHILWILGTQMISSVLFFVPIVRYLYAQLKTEFELSADAYVETVQNTDRYLKQAFVLNLEASQNNFPDFASSPIETRIEYLVNKRSTFEKVRPWQLSLSVVSLLLMLSIVAGYPKQIFAKFIADDDLICQTQSNCETPGCNENGLIQQDAFTIFIPASFQTSLSR